jgi:hypothetical protein
MTKFKLLSAALVAAAMLATPAMARTSRVTSGPLAEEVSPSAFPAAHYVSGPVGSRAPHVGAFAATRSDGENCDAGDNERIC